MRDPLNLEPRSTDPLLGLLAILALLGIVLTLGARSAKRGEPKGTTRALTAVELQLNLVKRLDAIQPGLLNRQLDVGTALREPWDRAAWAVDLREAGEGAKADAFRTPAPQGAEGLAFQSAWQAAYENGPLASATVPAPLKGSRAGALLENRLRARQGLPPLPIPEPNLSIFISLGLGACLLLLAGGATAVLLLVTMKRPKPTPPEWRMAGRGAWLVLLGWLVAFFVLNNAIQLAFRNVPNGKLWGLPLGYLAHAVFGVWLLMKVEGLSFRELIAKVAPEGRTGRALAWAPAFLGLAAFAMFIVALFMSPFLQGRPNPQQEVQDLLAGAHGAALQGCLFLTVAVLAPCFEELLFRGFLLPWSSARWGAAWGLAVSSLAFGFIHLQPWGLPQLSALGLVLGLAVRRSGSLWTSIAVHGCWNAGVFLLLRAL